jgi:hypothetical protein
MVHFQLEMSKRTSYGKNYCLDIRGRCLNVCPRPCLSTESFLLSADVAQTRRRADASARVPVSLCPHVRADAREHASRG